MKYMCLCSQVALSEEEFSDLLRQDNFDYCVKKSVFVRSALYFFVKNKRLGKYILERNGDISLLKYKSSVF